MLISAPLSSNTSTTCKNQHTGTIRALIQQYVYNLQKSTYWYNPRPYPAIRLQPAKINILVQSAPLSSNTSTTCKNQHTGTIRALIQQYVYNMQKSTYWYNPRPYPAIRLQPAKINILVQSALLSSSTSTTCKNQHTGTIRALIQQYVYNLQKSTYWYNQPLSSNTSTTCKNQHTGTIRALIQQYVYYLKTSTYWYNPRPYPAIRLQPAKINILVQSAPLSSNTSTTCKNQHTGTIRALIQQYVYNLQKSTYWYNPRPYPAIRLQPAKINILVQSALIQQYVYNLQKSTYWYNQPLSSNTSTTCKNQHTGTISPYPAIRLQPAKINILVQSTLLSSNTSTTCKDQHTGTIRALIQQYVYYLKTSTYWYNPRPYPAIRLLPENINILVQSAPLSSNTSTTCKNQHTGTIRTLIQQYVYNLQKSTYWYNPRSYQAIYRQPAKISIQYRHLLPAAVNQTSASAWLNKHPWNHVYRFII